MSQSAAAAREGSAPAPMAVSVQQTADTTPTAEPGKESSEEEEDLENDEKARLEEEQLVWDETVKDMMNMEIKQRKDEGDMEGIERGSNYRLRFNIWRTEREWKLQRMHEAKTESTLAPADNGNNTESENKAREPEKEARKDKDPTNDMGGHVNRGSVTKAICNPNLECEKPKAIISQTKQRMRQRGSRRLRVTGHLSFRWGQLHNSARGQLGPHSSKGHGNRQRFWFMSPAVWPIWLASTVLAAVWLKPRLPVLTLQDLITLFLYHWGIICFSLLLRDLTTVQQQVERLEQHLVQEEERREENNRRSRKRVWRSR